MSESPSEEKADHETSADIKALREVFREAGAPLTTTELGLLGMIRNNGWLTKATLNGEL